MKRKSNYEPPAFYVTKVTEDVITASTDNFGEYLEIWYS